MHYALALAMRQYDHGELRSLGIDVRPDEAVILFGDNAYKVSRAYTSAQCGQLVRKFVERARVERKAAQQATADGFVRMSKYIDIVEAGSSPSGKTLI